MVRRSILSNSILLTMTCAMLALSGCGGKNGLLGIGGGASLTSVTLTPANPTLTLSLSPPATRQFVATGQYSFGNPKDITNQLTWVSADTTVATMDNKGVATAVGSGRVIAGLTTLEARYCGYGTFAPNKKLLANEIAYQNSISCDGF